MTHPTLYDASAPVFKRMLGNLSQLLSKAHAQAEVKQYDPDVLLQQRLFPDMFALAGQIQIACDTAKLATARLTGRTAPVHADTEKTFEELQRRIRETIDFIDSVPVIAFSDSAARIVEVKQRSATLSLPAQQYLFNLALPNFYFHVTTAYNLLRHNGVEIGKRDYLGAMT